MSLFVYDRLIDATEFCNFVAEREKLLEYLRNGNCVKLFAPRNFGKTSLIKNIVGEDWVREDENKRTIVYIELYSVASLEDLSLKATQAFNKALSAKKSVGMRLSQIARALKSVKPTWQPPTEGSPNPFGEFSIRTDTGQSVVPFEEVFEQINRIQESGTFEFAIILDEFQEIAHISKAEALMRDALEKLSPKIPVVICGSKQHLLQKIFEQPRKPFHNWGNVIELKKIPVKEYTAFMNSKFSQVNLNISDEASAHLQEKLNHIPEQINRVADFLASISLSKKSRELTIADVDSALKKFVSDCASLFIGHYSALSSNERAVILAIVAFESVEKINSKDFLAKIPTLTAAAVSRIISRLLDSGVLQKFQKNHKNLVRIEDPLFALYIKESGLLMNLPETRRDANHFTKVNKGV